MFLKSNLMNVNKEVSVTSGNTVFLVYFPQRCERVTFWKDYTILSSSTLIPGNSRDLSSLLSRLAVRYGQE